MPLFKMPAVISEVASLVSIQYSQKNVLKVASTLVGLSTIEYNALIRNMFKY